MWSRSKGKQITVTAFTWLVGKLGKEGFIQSIGLRGGDGEFFESLVQEKKLTKEKISNVHLFRVKKKKIVDYNLRNHAVVLIQDA